MDEMAFAKMLDMSLPVWEEWIEMINMPTPPAVALRLFPYGKSGLKFLWQWAWPRGRSSLPVWEEWIEIESSESASAAWPGLFPYGKSGLKCLCICIYVCDTIVSSRMGRVD